MEIWLKFWVNEELVSIQKDSLIIPQVGQVWHISGLGDTRLTLEILEVEVVVFAEETIVNLKAKKIK